MKMVWRNVRIGGNNFGSGSQYAWVRWRVAPPGTFIWGLPSPKTTVTKMHHTMGGA